MKRINLVIGALSLIAIIISLLALSKDEKTAYIDYNEVYNNCDLKAQLEKDLESLVSSRESELDSMKLELTFMSNKIKAGETNQDDLNVFEDAKNRFLTFQGRYEEENIRLKEEYYTQIRNDINSKSILFGEENGYDYLFAAVGDGSLMYAKEANDVTEELTNYINKN